jgi:hypothetical protein
MQVTIVCATRNARSAVRLTFASFRRFTSEACKVLVADNGSTDGTLQDLSSLSWVQLYSIDERLRLMRAERAAARRLAARLDDWTDAGSPDHPCLIRNAQALLASMVRAVPGVPVTDHGATLDWLARRVETPFFLTMDSDVEFLAPGWLSAALVLMEQDRLDLLGEFEPNIASGQSRLAPHVLLLRTRTFRRWGVSFCGFAEIDDPDEARRWRKRGAQIRVDVAESASYQYARSYDTAAYLFQVARARRARWRDTPKAIRRMYRHLGHMSWSHDARHADDTFAACHRITSAYVQERLYEYGEVLEDFGF